ncbi:MAG TPA: DUF4358 domain-containing protein [Candidatus Intestinimonas merdavium]|mgnify:FL=1|uniref:DUF4358 domain-containing protein n=1 Tax=Candidatus Intestinimonas merdavium TaxID=2838622 RepID=A0A9D2CDG1_9FIRM|nr:DUF4358 domain-containing protein [Candidatus Intestinimonas merdavium]
MKRVLSAAAALTLALSLGTSALAYSGTITLNGASLSTATLPDAPTGAVIPLRAVVEADYGFVDWYADENRSFFSLDGNSIYVDCATGAIELNGETLSNMKATFVQGVTFVPASLLGKLEGCSAQVKGSDVTITTPNGDVLVRLARSIISEVGMAATMKLDAAGMAEMYNIPSDCFTEAVGFFPMMVSADTVVIGKVADGKMADAKAALEDQRALTQQNFEQYLPEPLERAKNGQVVTSGDYIMLIISGDNDTAIQMFQDGVK